MSREVEVRHSGYKTIILIAAVMRLAEPGLAFSTPANGMAVQDSTQAHLSADVVVQARRRDAVQSYVRKVAKPEPGRQLARWHQPLCIAFRGIAPEYEGAMAARIREVATSVRVKVLTPPCSTNLAIVLSHNVPAIIKAMLGEWPYRFGDLGSDQFIRARRAKDLLEPRAIRWFHGVVAVGEDGLPFFASNGPPINYSSIASRIRATTREEMAQSTILMDRDLLGGLTLGQLDDYVAFVALTTPDMTADYAGTESILSVLPAPTKADAPKALTDLDRDYLAALYATPADESPEAQMADIRGKLTRHLNK